MVVYFFRRIIKKINRFYMRFYNILDLEDSYYKAFSYLYKKSFPIFEQRTQEQQERAFNHPNYNLQAFFDGNLFVGVVSFWEFAQYIYVEHLAIMDEHRGKGYGHKMIQNFVRTNLKKIILEIDPLVDDTSFARLRFYKDCGFFENPYDHKHPPDRKGFKPHSLLVLSSKNRISESEYEIFKSDLENVVMALNI